MNVRSFIDTNILVYTDDHDALEKQKRAFDLVEQACLSRNGVLSTQVLQEYFVTATRKLNVEPAIARRKVELFARLDLVQIDLDAILAAIDGHGVALGDSALVADDIAAGRLVQPFEMALKGPPQFAYYVISPEETADEPMVRAFREWVLSEAGQSAAARG